MIVRSETGIMSARDTFSMGGGAAVPSPQPSLQGMRLAFTSDGTSIYKPISTSTTAPAHDSAGSTVPTGNPAGLVDVSDSAAPESVGQGLNISVGDPVKRKRGRPRKYGPDGTMALAPSPVSASCVGGGGSTPGFSPSSVGATTSAEANAKKSRGRPAGSGRKQQMAALGSAGIGFTPHIIKVKAGEDVSSKIISFSQHGPRAVCILSANGAISNVTLRQAATSGGTVTYEGRFEILSLSGSFLLSESGGQRSRTGGLSVSLAGPDGRVLGGGVAGLLTAASPVQVVVGSFIADGGRKESKHANNNTPSDPASVPAKIAPIGMTGPSSPPSRGMQSESLGGSGSPLNQSSGACDNNNQQGSGFYGMLWK